MGRGFESRRDHIKKEFKFRFKLFFCIVLFVFSHGRLCLSRNWRSWTLAKNTRKFFCPQITQIITKVISFISHRLHRYHAVFIPNWCWLTILLVSIFCFSCGSLLRYTYGEGMVILTPFGRDFCYARHSSNKFGSALAYRKNSYMFRISFVYPS